MVVANGSTLLPETSVAWQHLPASVPFNQMLRSVPGVSISVVAEQMASESLAVLNHNSEFSVIPEPSTMVAGALGMLELLSVAYAAAESCRSVCISLVARPF